MFSLDTVILIVSEHMESRKLTRRSFLELGFSHFEEAQSGVEAWRRLTSSVKGSRPIGLVVSDSKPPTMEGMRLLSQIRGDQSHLSQLPFVLMTEVGDKKHVTLALKKGASSYLLKPFSTAQLEQKLKGAWRMHQLHSQAA